MLTRAEVAERMNANPLTVWRLETGRVVRPEIETVGRFLQACGESWSALVGKLDSAGRVELKLIFYSSGSLRRRDPLI